LSRSADLYNLKSTKNNKDAKFGFRVGFVLDIDILILKDSRLKILH